MGVKTYRSSAIAYFHEEGRTNLRHVLRLVQRARCKRPELQNLKIVFMTAFGEGPLLATRLFKNNRPKMVAVTFPPTVKLPDGNPYVISEQVEAYLRAMKVDLVRARLPFDGFGGNTPADQQMLLIKSILRSFGRSMPMCVEAVLQACDAGLVEEGEDVIGITGDMAAVITASTTSKFLSSQSVFSVREFICKSEKQVQRPPAGAPLALSPPQEQK